ncbi:hypothetical protein [Exiguobacterium artemiae]
MKNNLQDKIVKLENQIKRLNLDVEDIELSKLILIKGNNVEFLSIINEVEDFMIEIEAYNETIVKINQSLIEKSSMDSLIQKRKNLKKVINNLEETKKMYFNF